MARKGISTKSAAQTAVNAKDSEWGMVLRSYAQRRMLLDSVGLSPSLRGCNPSLQGNPRVSYGYQGRCLRLRRPKKPMPPKPVRSIGNAAGSATGARFNEPE